MSLFNSTTVAGLNIEIDNLIGQILAGGLIDVMFGPDGPDRRVGIAYDLMSDEADLAVATVHAASYEQVQIELYAALVRAGYGMAVAS